LKWTVKKVKNRAILSAAAAWTIYSIAAGKGPFNKKRFKEQHEALSRYVDNNYPDCSYSPITMHGRGWSSCVKKYGRIMCFVYFTKDDNGNYIFTESKDRK
jgi:hypothetical protein